MTKQKESMSKLNNQRHESFARALVKVGSQKKAYMEVYPGATHRSASTCATRVLSKHPEIKERASEIADRNGVTQDRCMRKIAQLMDAKKKVLINNRFRKVDDNNIQLNATQTGLKIHGLLKENNQEYNQYNDNRVVSISKINAKTDNKLLENIKKLNDNLALLKDNNYLIPNKEEINVITDETEDL